MPVWLIITFSALGAAGTIFGIAKAIRTANKAKHDMEISAAEDRGRREVERLQIKKDLDGMGAKINNVRAELQAQIDEQKREHTELRRSVQRIDTNTEANRIALDAIKEGVDRLLSIHVKE